MVNSSTISSRLILVSRGSPSYAKPMEHGILVEKVTKSFPQSGLALGPLDIQIRGGDFVSILGPTGCGKSTFLRILAGLENQSSGTIARKNLKMSSFVFQEPTLLPWRSVLENVLLPLEISDSVSLERAENALREVQLLEAGSLLPAQLSGGMKMRTSLARALVTEPQFMFLDEPFSALDENTRHQMQLNLRELWVRTQMTVVFVTHSVSEAVFLSNRCLVLSPKPGRIVADRAIVLPEKRNSEIHFDSQFLELVKTLQREMK
ncbi:MAG: ABC transporter ATP-binding protein [Pseudobdellovibrionaceae bacterium]